MLGVAEKFIKEMASIPRLSIRLGCCMTYFTFSSRLEELDDKIFILETACNEIFSATSLVAVLQTILSVGNYMNGGTSRGGCWAFKLEFLAKLSQIKATGSKHTLMHYITNCMPDHIGTSFYEGLEHIESASTLSLSMLQNDATTLKSMLLVVKSEILKLEGAQNESYVSKMNTFLKDGLKKHDATMSNLTRTNENFQQAARRFGYDIQQDAEDVRIHIQP